MSNSDLTSSGSQVAVAPASPQVAAANAGVATGITSSPAGVRPVGVTSLNLGKQSGKGEVVASSPPLSPREQARKEKEFQELVIEDKIEIVGTKTLTQEFDNKPYTVYRISIGGIEFEKRYSEFRDFYDALITKTGYEFPNFPGKLSFNNMGAATIQKRTLALTEFLNHVNKSVGDSPERAMLLDNFLMNANKLVIMQVATALLQSVVTYVPEVKAGIDAAVSVAKVASNFPVDKLSFMTNITPVCSALQAWGDEVFEVASNQLEKKQRKKVMEGVYLYNLAIHISRRFETDSSVQLASALLKQLTSKDNTFLDAKDRGLFDAKRFWEPRKRLEKLRKRLQEHLAEHPEKAKHHSKKLTKRYVRTLAAMLPIETPPCEFCIVAGGDIGRRETMGFSHLDFAIVVESKHKLHHNQEYFNKLNHLLGLQIINLGDTVKSRGGGIINPFAHITNGRTIQVMLLNRFYLISGMRQDFSVVSPLVDPQEFITTPKKLVKSLSPEASVGGDVEVRKALHYTRFIAGSQSVYDAFVKVKIEEETKRLGEQHDRLVAGIAELREFLEELRSLRSEHNDFIVDVKVDLFRPFHTIIDAISRIVFSPEELSNNESHTWKHLEMLKQAGFLNDSSWKTLKDTFDSIVTLRQTVQVFYGSEEEKIYPENADDGLYDPKFKINSKCASQIENAFAIIFALIDVVRQLEKEKETVSRTTAKWSTSTSQALNVVLKAVGEQQRGLEAAALICYLRNDYASAIDEFEKALPLVVEDSYLDRERRKTIQRFILVSLFYILEGKQTPKKDNLDAEALQGLRKKAKDLLEDLKSELNAHLAETSESGEVDTSLTLQEEISFVEIQLTRLELLEGVRPSTELIEESNTVLEKAAAIVTPSDRFLATLLMLRGESLERYYSLLEKEKRKESKAVIDAAYADFLKAQECFGTYRRFASQCDAILHIINTCQLIGSKDSEKEATKWKQQLEEIYLRHDVHEKHRVFIEAIRTCGLALTPLLKDHVSDMVKDHLKKELIKQAKKNTHHLAKCSIQ